LYVPVTIWLALWLGDSAKALIVMVFEIGIAFIYFWRVGELLGSLPSIV
jgi:hypothetical protein